MGKNKYIQHHKAIIFGTEHSPMLPEIMKHLKNYSQKKKMFFLGKTVTKKFNNGEFLTHIDESVREAEVFIFAQPRFHRNLLHGDIFEILQLIRSAKVGKAYRVHIIIPTIPYSRQDRKTRDREFPSFRLLIDLINSAGVSSLTTFGIHNDATVGYAKWSMENISMTSFMAKIIKEKIIDKIGNVDEISLGSADIGGAKFIEKLSQKMYESYHINLNSIIIEKHRNPQTGKTKIKGIIGEPKKTVIFVDDMIDTAGTAKNASLFVKKMGVEKTYMVAIHPVFGAGVEKNLPKADFEKIITSNACVNETVSFKNHKTVSMAKMVAGIIDNIHNKKSVSHYINTY